jgi:hypothetical protein
MRRAQWESGQEGAHGARLDTMEGGEEQAWQQCRPLKLLFLSAGIGITPAIAMLRGLQTAARGQTPLLPCMCSGRGAGALGELDGTSALQGRAGGHGSR